MRLESLKSIGNVFIKKVKHRIDNIKITSFSVTDTGLERDNNEDSVLIVEKRKKNQDTNKLGKMYVIADGMGGHAAGETASRMSCLGLLEYYDINRPSTGNPCQRLSQLIEQIDKQILDYSIENLKMAGMGTTLSVLLILQDSAYIAHIGDSRIYRFRDNNLELLTKDHTQVQELLDMGRLTKEEAKTYYLRHVITQAVGTKKGFKNIFTREEKILPKDRFLICSDGLHDMVSEDEVQKIIAKDISAEKICKKLLTMALQNGGKDNISIVVVNIS